MQIKKLSSSKIYQEVYNSLSFNDRLDASWGWDKNNTVRWPVGLQAKMDRWVNVSTKLKFLRENLVRAANRESAHEIQITLDELYLIGESQNWKCSFTNIPLEFQRGGTEWGGKWCNPYSCTIDRIDSTKGYIKGNVQLVVWKVNSIKSNLADDDFVDICKRVAVTR